MNKIRSETIAIYVLCSNAVALIFVCCSGQIRTVSGLLSGQIHAVIGSLSFISRDLMEMSPYLKIQRHDGMVALALYTF